VVNRAFEEILSLVATRPLTNEILQESQTRLSALAGGDEDALANTTATIISRLQSALEAIGTRHFSRATALLDEGSKLASQGPPALQDALQSVRDTIALPTLREIRGRLGKAGTIVKQNPLDEEALDAAESILQEIIALWADQPDATAGLAGIAHLRAVRALRETDLDAAKEALDEADRAFTKVGFRNLLKDVTLK
ncbi:MAG: hypothetical protein K0U93_08795, partial [Gammaproteobacteria bacterium]|nr:hypothetical protein [Gammaproteobacteria bacterium]